MTETIGCFGSVLYYDQEGRRCSRCPLAADCKVAVAANKSKLEALLQTVKADPKKSASQRKMAAKGIETNARPTSPGRTVASAPAAIKPITTGSGLNKKPAAYVEAWARKGLRFEAAREGVNPFIGSGNKFAVVAMEILFAYRTISKDDMTEELIKRLGWGPGTASSHAGIIFDAFAYLGIIKVFGDKAELK